MYQFDDSDTHMNDTFSLFVHNDFGLKNNLREIFIGDFASGI